MNLDTFAIFQKILVLPKFSKISSRTFGAFGLILIGVLSVIYIFQVNSMIKEAYLVRNYQRKLKELARENKILEVNFSQSNSLANLEKLIIKDLKFEKIEKIYYIEVLGNQVVSK